MRVLLSALALTALLLLAGAASVLAADGALPGDAPVTLDPAEPPPPPTPDTAGSAVEAVTQTAEPATQPVAAAAAPVVAAIADVAAPAAGPVGDAVEPTVDSVVDLVAPVAAPVTDVVDPVVSPIVDVTDPVIQPVLDIVEPVTGPIVDVVDPVTDPGIDPVPPVTGPGVGVDSAGLAGVTAPAFDPNSLLSGGVAWFDGDSSFGNPREWSISHGLVVVDIDTAPAGTSASSPGNPWGLPWGLPWQPAPFGLPSDAAGSGSSLSLGAWTALLTAGLLVIVFYAFRRPWSSVPILRGRSLLPALRPA